MDLAETLRRIEEKLEKIEAELNEMRHQLVETIMVNEKKLVSLPDHLRKTAVGLMKAGQGSANDVCKYTNRARAVESSYLNQLEREGLVKSFRRGRQKIFQLEEDLAEKLAAKKEIL